MSIFSYLFWPNPGNAHYSDPTMLGFLSVGLVLLVASFALRAWRGGTSDHRLKKLSASWQSASLWFGLVILFLVVCRVEHIQFLAMRALLIVWAVALAAYVLWQLQRYRTQYFQILPREHATDERAKYLPKRRH